MRKILLLTLALALVLGSPVSAHHGPTKTVLKAATAKQPPVPFDHQKHAEKLAKTCDTCHHTNKGLTDATAAKAKVQKCSSCHLKPQGKMKAMSDMSPTLNPMHANCISCHKAQKKGPTVCKDCHVKK